MEASPVMWFAVFNIVVFVGMCVWVIILDTRLEQMEGYIKRLERELQEARSDRWRRR